MEGDHYSFSILLEYFIYLKEYQSPMPLMFAVQKQSDIPSIKNKLHLLNNLN